MSLVNVVAPVLEPSNLIRLLVKVWVPVHVGLMACDKAGAPSERIALVAVPLTAVRPIVPVGFATLPPPPLFTVWLQSMVVPFEVSSQVSPVGMPVPDTQPAPALIVDVVVMAAVEAE